MMNPFEGLFFDQGTKRQGMDDFFGVGSYLSSSVASLEGDFESYLDDDQNSNSVPKKHGNVQVCCTKFRLALYCLSDNTLNENK